MDNNYMPPEPQSQIKKSGFRKFLSTLYGWRAKGRSKSTRSSNIEFKQVDVDSGESLAQAVARNLAAGGGKLSDRLGSLFNDWLADTQDSLSEISERQRRVDQLQYAKLNDPFIGRVVKLYADEATQLDVQDQIISIETPDPRQTKDMYKLLSQWGITQQRVRSTIEQLATFGDAFWANKVSEQGVERIIPVKQMQISDRLEFNPVEALERKKRKEGGLATLADRHSLIQQMLDEMEQAEDIADLFDTKLFGFVIENDLVVPPWSITHFRVEADRSEFYPFGVSPILGTLAPFKLTQSTITLQSIARILSFPITLYKVKTTDKADEGLQFATVNRVREEYDNIGVSPSGGNSEVYSVNTKIWMPDGLLDVDVKESKVDIGFTDDIAMYQDRVAVATGIPKGYLTQEWGGFGNSAISLTEQFKPFARQVYSIQAAFLETLADLFRLHYVITGKFDFRTPFTLSLKYPGEEMSAEKLQTRTDSMELAREVLDLVRTAIGAEEDEGLPPEIVRDVIAKYSFIDPADIVKWTKGAIRSAPIGSGSISGGGSSHDFSGEDFDYEDMDSDYDEIGDMGDEEPTPEEGVEEVEDEVSKELKDDLENLGESVVRFNRMRELTKRYKESADNVYFTVLKECAISSFVRKGKHVHISLREDSSLSLMLNTWNGSNGTKNRLREYTLTDMLEQVKEENTYNPEEDDYNLEDNDITN